MDLLTIGKWTIKINIMPWPSGVDGVLVVNQGEVATISGGSISDYASITVNEGGILEIDESDYWTFIGCAGEFLLKGEVRAVKGTLDGNMAHGMAPNGDQIHFMGFPMLVGGSGGKNSDNTVGGSVEGGKGNLYGNGGGGAAMRAPGQNASFQSGGEGGTTTTADWQGRPGGRGGRQRGEDGDSGGSIVTPLSGIVNCGGGGGGGRCGYNGGLLYIAVTGILNATGGTFNLGGSGGGKGGTGGNAQGFPPNSGNCPGAGGGGGSGGNGGYLILRYSQTYSPGTYSVAGGRGGRGGGGGNSDTGFGNNGSDGTDGANGRYELRH